VESIFTQQQSDAELPDSVDYHYLDVIKNPRDQGKCGSCWAFTADNAMRAHAQLYTKRTHTFSIGQVVDCMPNPEHCGGKGGCKGATAQLAFEYVLQHGVTDEKVWPYELDIDDDGNKFVADSGHHCPSQSLIQTELQAKHVKLKDGSVVSTLGEGRAAELGSRRVQMYGWTKFAVNKQDQLMRALAEIGPVTVSLAVGKNWFMYHRGVMQGEGACEPNNVIGHANVLFGYGEEQGTKYWSLLNSWGPDWGDRGTSKLLRTDTEEKACGWDNHPERGNGCDNGPTKVWVCGTCGILFNTAVPHFAPLEI